MKVHIIKIVMNSHDAASNQIATWDLNFQFDYIVEGQESLNNFIQWDTFLLKKHKCDA